MHEMFSVETAYGPYGRLGYSRGIVAISVCTRCTGSVYNMEASLVVVFMDIRS